MMNDVSLLKEVGIDQLDQLRSLCLDLYPFYFGDYWTTEGLSAYMKEQFGYESLNRDLKSPKIKYFMINHADPHGFLKLNVDVTLEGYENVKCAELEKMYIHHKQKGKGLGSLAMSELIRLLHAEGFKLLFLEVLDSNNSAISFYQKSGFEHYRSYRLTYETFKEEYRGLNQMILNL